LRRTTENFSRRSPRPTQFGIRSLLVGVTIIAVLLAARAYSLALHVFVVGLLVFIGDWAALVLAKTGWSTPGFDWPVQHQHWRYKPRATAPQEPTIVAIVYMTFFVTWHMFTYLAIVGTYFFSFYGLKNEIGLSIRVIEHTINAAMLTYLVVHLICALFQSNLRATDRIPLLFAISIVVKMFWAIA
jgi:hypothetical protein